MESPADGILIEIFFSEGDEVPVLSMVALIGSESEEPDSFRSAGSKIEGRLPEIKVIKGEAKIRENAKNEISDIGDRIKISPRAKILAVTKGVALSGITGSGPAGRIIVRDIENTISGIGSRLSGERQPATSNQQPDIGYTDKPLSNVRKLISKAMHSPLQNSAQLTHHMSADVRKLLAIRNRIKETSDGKGGNDITLNDMICWCVIRALEKFPEMNSHFLDTGIRTFKNVNLGIAVDTPRGLMVPVVKNADTMDLAALSAGLKSVAEACRKGNIDPELLHSYSASFTVSNLGNYGVEMFTPVINLPQAGILGVCTILNRPVDLGNNTFGFIPVIGLSLTYDHRAVDGGPATLFLKKIKERIESFEY
jgi:pyruvate dehydrogenase E2 component (dihydrolipoamide acetyltransferase)